MRNSLVFRDGCLKVVRKVILVCIQSIGIVNLLIVNVDFNIWKNWTHYVVYIGNSSYFFLLVIACFSENNRFIFVLLFLFLTLVCIVTNVLWQIWASMPKKTVSNHCNSFDPFEIQTLCSLQTLCKWGSWINFLFMRGQDIVNNWDFPCKVSRHCHKRLVPKIVVWHDQREMFLKMSLRDRLDCLVDSVSMILLCLLPLPNCFLQSFLSHILCSRLERLSTANNLCNLWCSNLQHVSTYACCCWDDIFTQKWNCSSPNNLCKSPKSPFSLSSNPSIVRNFYLSWSKHLVVSYVLEMNVGHLPKHQNKPSDTDIYKGYLFTRWVSQINVCTMKWIFEQRSNL